LSADFLRMAGDNNDDFRTLPQPGNARRGRAQSFVGQVNIAVRKADGDPNRIGGPAGKGSGRFNARGRGAKVVGHFRRERDGWSRDGCGARFRPRRVVVKARMAKLNPQRGSHGPKMRGDGSEGRRCSPAVPRARWGDQGWREGAGLFGWGG
jgi:hypothetical protein